MTNDGQVRIDHGVTTGTFELDGGTWEVDNNVWVVGDDSRVAIAPVVIERFQDGIVLIDSGLTPGQRVVGAGSQMLFPGRPVATSDAIPNEPARPEHADDGAGTTGATTAAPPATAQPKATP